MSEDMSKTETPETWRVECVDGPREVSVTFRPHDTMPTWLAYCYAERRGGMLSQNSARHAVIELAANHKWDVECILAPGQQSAAEREQAAADRNAALVACDHQGRILDRLMDLVRNGNFRTAQTFVEEVDDPRLAAERGLELTGEDQVTATGWAVDVLAACLADHLDGRKVKNTIEWKLTLPDGRRMTLSGRWARGKSPMDLYAESKAELDQARADIATLQGELSRAVAEGATLRRAERAPFAAEAPHG